MSEVFDCTTPDGLAAGIEAAAQAVRDGKVVVLPTDTVYGIGADAFNPDAVSAVLAAKGRGREMPPPVLVPNLRTVDGLARDVPDYVRALLARFWPGALTVVVKSQPSLSWDLGETNGTVAIRMPDNEVALSLLSDVGPMAVTSANLTGSPAARTVAEAQDQLGAAVAVYLDGGPATGTAASTMLDCTTAYPVTLREGAIPRSVIDAALEEAARVAEAERLAEEKRAAAEGRPPRGPRGVGRPGPRPAASAPARRGGRVAGQRRRPRT
jgi:tRNA threonylcarbamoyl adenosine modification protein (Sua5/YciO/YrdC/YwlC family)